MKNRITFNIWRSCWLIDKRLMCKYAFHLIEVKQHEVINNWRTIPNHKVKFISDLALYRFCPSPWKPIINWWNRYVSGLFLKFTSVVCQTKRRMVLNMVVGSTLALFILIIRTSEIKFQEKQRSKAFLDLPMAWIAAMKIFTCNGNDVLWK